MRKLRLYFWLFWSPLSDVEFNKVNYIPGSVKRKQLLSIHTQGNSLAKTLIRLNINEIDQDEREKEI